MPEAEFAVALQFQDRTEQPADGFAQLDRFNVENVAFAAFEGHDADRMPIIEQWDRTYGNVPEFAGQLSVGDRRNFMSVTRWVNQRDIEIENFVHGLTDQAGKIHLGIERSGVRD